MIYRDKNYMSEVQFIFDNLKTNSSVNRRILDLGCGTGIHSKELAQKGFIAVGLDLNIEFINKAVSRETEISNNLFIVGDMKSIPFKKSKFGTIIMMFHVINFLVSDEELVDFFKKAFDLLLPGGQLIFDSWHSESLTSSDFETKIKLYENMNFKIKRKSTIKSLPSGIINVKHDFEILNISTNKTEKILESHLLNPLNYTRIRACASSIFHNIEFKDISNLKIDESRTYRSFYSILHKY